MSDASAESAWLQGSILKAEHTHSLRQRGLIPPDWGDDDVIVILTHSCDLAPRVAAGEPFVELICGVVQEGLNGNCTHGKNPRELHVEILLSGGQRPVAFNIHRRHPVSREAILDEESPRAQLHDQTRRLMARWAGKRYWREAFPDTFNERLSHLSNDLRKFMRGQGGTDLTGLYVVLDSDEELPSGVDYHIDLIGTMRPEAYEDVARRDVVQEALDRFSALVNRTDGVEVGETMLLSERAVSLHDLRVFRRWDYDDLSMRQAEPPIAPEAPS